MKKFLAAILFVFALAQLSSCQTSISGKDGKISPDEFEQKLNSVENAQLIDVRTPEEYTKGFIKGAKNIDWNGNSFDALTNKLDKNKAVFVYCLGGGRSGEAASHLKELGFKEVFDLSGGMMAWNNAGKPVVEATSAVKVQGMSLSEYNQKINSDKLVLVDFNAPWCGPCKKMAPMLEELANANREKFILIKINFDENKDLAKSLNVSGLPKLILYKNGGVVFQKEGITEKAELTEAINKN